MQQGKLLFCRCPTVGKGGKEMEFLFGGGGGGGGSGGADSEAGTRGGLLYLC